MQAGDERGDRPLESGSATSTSMSLGESSALYSDDRDPRWPFDSRPEHRGRSSWRALWCGIVSVIGGVVFGWTLPFAVAAIVLGSIGIVRSTGHRGNNVGAVVFGGIGLLLSFLWIGYSILVVAGVLPTGQQIF